MAPRQNVQAAEVAVFLFLIVPSLILSLFAIRQEQLSFVLAATATIFRDLGLVCLIVFFLWQNDEPVDRLGWSWHHAGQEMISGIGCFVPVFFVAGFLIEPCCGPDCPRPRPLYLPFCMTRGPQKRSWQCSWS